jgi:hypothetical protein
MIASLLPEHGEHRIRTRDGRVLEVTEWGDPKGIPLFALHRTPGDRGEGRRCRRPDQSRGTSFKGTTSILITATVKGCSGPARTSRQRPDRA